MITTSQIYRLVLVDWASSRSCTYRATISTYYRQNCVRTRSPLSCVCVFFFVVLNVAILLPTGLVEHLRSEKASVQDTGYMLCASEVLKETVFTTVYAASPRPTHRVSASCSMVVCKSIFIGRSGSQWCVCVCVGGGG